MMYSAKSRWERLKLKLWFEGFVSGSHLKLNSYSTASAVLEFLSALTIAVFVLSLGAVRWVVVENYRGLGNPATLQWVRMGLEMNGNAATPHWSCTQVLYLLINFEIAPQCRWSVKFLVFLEKVLNLLQFSNILPSWKLALNILSILVTRWTNSTPHNLRRITVWQSQ